MIKSELRPDATAYLQTTATECGLACLGWAAASLGHAFEMSELRARFAISMRGTTLADLVRLAGALGLQARPLRLELDELNQLAVPCILHWDMSHFVVLKRVWRDHIVIHDPAYGERLLPITQASSHFTGIALELTPAPEFEHITPKPPICWRQLVGRVDGLRRSLGQLLVVAASLQVMALIAPFFTQWIVDGAIVSGDVDLLWVLGIGFVMVMLIRLGLEALRGWLGLVIATQFGTQWAARVMGHLLRLPIQWFEMRHTGDVVSRFQSMQNIQQTVTGKLVEILLDGLFGLITLVVMLLYSAKLASVVIGSLVCYAAIRVLPHAAYHRANGEALTHEARAQTHFLESLRAMQTIKLAGMEAQRGARWLNLAVEGINCRVRTQKMTLFFGAGYSLAFGLESIIVLGWGASLVINGLLTVGMLMAFISYKDEFSSRMQRFIDNLMSIRMLRLHVERLSDIVLADKEQTDGTMPEQLDPAGWLESSVQLDNVSFRYGDGAAWVLRNINLEIRAGEHVAITGPTGCGKTTLAKIILGLLIPTEGVVRVGGLPLSQIGLANWRRHVGAVMQDDQLLSSNLQDSICGFADHIDFERLRSAAGLAAIDDEIATMPMGFHTLIGDMGNSLSGGQKQRILLARAFYREPRVLVLDEATSHLDVGRERQVNEAIKHLPVTRITIAHRPETIKMADRVIDLSGINYAGKRTSAALSV